MVLRTAIPACALVLVALALHPGPARGAGSASAKETSPADLHIKFSSPRPQTPQCEQRGKELVETLSKSLEEYKDYKAAEAAGYSGYYTGSELPMYHFASKWRAFKELVRFDPAQPTVLLYKKSGGNYQLIGAMYYAPGSYSEDRLDGRVPLCLARWHRQVNVCLPPSGAEDSSDPRFGSDGTIATQAQCTKAGGKWYPEVHGWMVEVYPFENDPKKIWGYRPG